MSLLDMFNKAKNTKKTVKNIINKIGKVVAALPFIIKVFAILTIIATVSGIVDMVLEWISAESNPEDVYETLGIDDVSQLVEIKEAGDGTYYLDFVDGFDEKVETIVENSDSQNGLHPLPSTDFVKKLIKAEVITQFPNLGGTIPEGTNGFQGAIDIIRVMPDKEIGSLKSPGSGATSNIEPEVTYDTVDFNNEYENMVKSWTEGQAVSFIKNAYIYIEQDGEIGEWAKTETEEKITKGTTGTYTGTWKKTFDPLKEKTYVYIQIKTGEKTVFVRAENVEILKKSQNTQISRTTQKVTSRAENQKKVAGDDATRTYTIAIGAGHNNSDQRGIEYGNLKEEELTIKVAEKVEELFEANYENVDVVQIGSTSSNPSGIKDQDRINLAKDANPDLCIQIHFGAGDSGVQAIYRDGDEVSGQLAGILAEKVSASMNLKNKGSGTDINKCSGQALGVIENSAISRFPSVVVEGGSIYMDDKALSDSSAVENYAQGIIDGILDYIVADHSGYKAAKVEKQEVAESIRSNVYKLKYVEPNVLNQYLEKGYNSSNKEWYKIYTIDESNNIVTLSWNKKEDGTVELTKNTGNINLKTALQKYVMPYEYLLYFYIDTDETELSEMLADEIIDNTEIVLTLQDNISTIKTDTDIQRRKISINKEFSKDWKSKETTSVTVESCTTSTDITYINTWCVKYYKENSFSNAALNWAEGETEKLGIDIKGKVVSSGGTPTFTDNGVKERGKDKKVEKNDEGEDVDKYYDFKIYQRTITTVDSLTTKYEPEEGKIDKENSGKKFIDAYKSTEAYRVVRTDYLFDIIESNERTANLLDLTKYLIHQATGETYDNITDFDFSKYQYKSFSSIGAVGGDISLVNPTLTKEQFKQALQLYFDKTENTSFKNNFLGQADQIYDWGIQYGVNPEIIITMAQKESGFKSKNGNQNYWGLGTPNGSSLAYIASFEEGVKQLAQTFSKYMSGSGTWQEEQIIQTYNERQAAGCNSNGYGMPGTLKGMLSIYSDLIGDYNGGLHCYGSLGAGGTIYLEKIYREDFDAKCGFHENGSIEAGGHTASTPFTIQEKADYTAWLYEKQLEYWNDFFGQFSSGNTITQEAVKLHKYLRENGYYYQQAGIYVPNEKTKSIDCSSFVTWVLVNAKVDGFNEGIYQWSSKTFAKNSKGWLTVDVASAQPGDIVVYNEHVEIIAKNDLTSDKFVVYNCGGTTSIEAEGTPDLPESSTSGHKKSEVKKILRPN